MIRTKGTRALEFEKVTTRGGDRGETSLYDGSRLRKDDLLFDTMGDVDELNSYIGLLKSHHDEVNRSRKFVRNIAQIQEDLLRIGAMIATPVKSELYATINPIQQKDVERIEALEHALMAETEIADAFVLPGQTKPAAYTDVARAVCRRVERQLVRCIRDRSLAHLIPCQHYLNRLSDYLFVLARSLS